jgi:hypothetical protein
VDFTGSDSVEGVETDGRVYNAFPFSSFYRIINQINTHEPSVNTRPLASRLPNILTDLCLLHYAQKNPLRSTGYEPGLAYIHSIT